MHLRMAVTYAYSYIYTHIYRYISIYLSVYLSIYLLAIYLSIYLPICLPNHGLLFCLLGRNRRRRCGQAGRRAGRLSHLLRHRRCECPTFLGTHHTQQISKAAVVNDSKAILKYIISRKQKACSCAPSTTGAAYAASGAWRA